MERMTGKEREQALEVILAEAREGAFPSKAAGRRWLVSIEGMAIELHSLYEGQCSVDLGATGNATRDSRARSTDGAIKHAFASAGLGLYLNGDPRGNPVGILTPKTGRYNTMGGAECGWRL